MRSLIKLQRIRGTANGREFKSKRIKERESQAQDGFRLD